MNSVYPEAPMKEPMHITLFLKQDKSNLVAFSSVLHHGFQVKAMVGCSIKDLLCDQFKVAEDVLKHRIQTLLLDGKPVDDEETATVKDGATIALSIALGGLLGASLRKEGGFWPIIEAQLPIRKKRPRK